MCECRCGKTEDTYYAPNPYAEEINGIIDCEWYCDDCYDQDAGDI